MKRAVCLFYFALWLNLIVCASSYVDDASFEHIAVESGLSNYNAGTISQDSLGYLWIGTSRGLNRYDGEEFKHYLFDPESPEQGIPHDMILNVLCAKNHVFVLTTRGVVVLNQKTDKWHKIASNRSIVDFKEYNGKVYFIFNRRIYYYDFQLGELVKDPKFEAYDVFRFIDSNDGRFWFASEAFRRAMAYDQQLQLCVDIDLRDRHVLQKPVVFNDYFIAKQRGGVFLYQIDDNKLIRKPSAALKPLASAKISRFFPLSDEVLAIATMGEGLFLYQVKENRLDRFHTQDGVSSLGSDFIKNLYLDADQNFWVSTFDKGLNVDYNEHNKFNPSRDLNLKTENHFINCIVYSNYKQDLLFGSRKSGIISQKMGTDLYVNKLLKKQNIESVISIFEDSQSKLWIGGIEDIFLYDQETRVLKKLPHSSRIKHVEGATELDGKVYLASETNGISVYSLEGKYLYAIASDVFGINQLIHLSPAKSYFCSIRYGLYSLNCQTKTYERLELLKNGQNFDWEGAVCLQLQGESTLWIGTLSWGLVKVDLNTLECITYSKNDGLPGNDVTAIELDDNGHLWLSTSDGISCMYDDGKFSNFSAYVGVGNYQFHRRSSLKMDDGMIFFGGNNGLTYFNPNQIDHKQELKGKVVLESLSSRGNEVKPHDATGILSTSLPYTHSLSFDYDYTNFSIKFTLPHLFAHEQIKYAYKLEGLDKDWHESLGAQSIYYTNLPAGKYIFAVKASRGSNVWTEQTLIPIELKRAPWFRWWAFLIYFIIVLSIISVIFMLTFSRKVAKANLDNEQKEHKRENEINEMKHRFFTNISHELRTPLTIIHAISDVKAHELNSSDKVSYFLKNLHLNTERLKRLVDQLLTFRNLERDTLHLDICRQDLRFIVERVVEPFQLFTEQKNITFSMHCELIEKPYAVDRDKIEKILNNLLDNAIKYTPRGGKVKLSVREVSLAEALEQEWDVLQTIEAQYDAYILFEVCDSGIGIEADALKHIFDRYYKASSNIDYSGTGIGLNFVKRLIDLYQGKIRANSTVGEGTCFSFIIPRYTDETAYPIAKDQVENTVDEEAIETIEQSKVEIPEAYTGRTLLIVEDDIALNNLLCKSYENLFKVYSAYDSHEGMILAKNKFPDLIISDVMMGEVDEGLKFCTSIKKDPHISHIPVVLLTARTEKDQIVEGYSCGADAYMTKPFDIQVLSSNIVSLLENRDRLQKDMLTTSLPKKESKDNYNQNDIVFIKKINEVISKQYTNPKFNIASLSRELLVSRSAFYNKFTQVTKLSPNDYLRKYRINKAIELMIEDQYSITQIVEMVGFNSRSGFYSSFKKEKNMTPTEFMKKNKE